MLGLPRGTVKLVAHHRRWRASFQREATRIRKVFDQDAIDIQHVGSTAIPGVPAKPVIDIGVVVPSFSRARRYLTSLRRIGYVVKKNDGRAERMFFTKGPPWRRTHYLHVGEEGSGYVEGMVLFRDYLRSHQQAARAYARLKQRLASRYSGEREIYTAKKGTMINAIVRKAKKLLRQR